MFYAQKTTAGQSTNGKFVPAFVQVRTAHLRRYVHTNSNIFFYRASPSPIHHSSYVLRLSTASREETMQCLFNTATLKKYIDFVLKTCREERKKRPFTFINIDDRSIHFDLLLTSSNILYLSIL